MIYYFLHICFSLHCVEPLLQFEHSVPITEFSPPDLSFTVCPVLPENVSVCKHGDDDSAHPKQASARVSSEVLQLGHFHRQKLLYSWIEDISSFASMFKRVSFLFDEFISQRSTPGGLLFDQVVLRFRYTVRVRHFCGQIIKCYSVSLTFGFGYSRWISVIQIGRAHV